MDLPLGQPFYLLPSSPGPWVFLVGGKEVGEGRQRPSEWGDVPALVLAGSTFPHDVIVSM